MILLLPVLLAIAQETPPIPLPRTATSTRIECATSRDLYRLALEAAKHFELCASDLHGCRLGRIDCEARMTRIRQRMFGVPTSAPQTQQQESGTEWWVWPLVVLAGIGGIAAGAIACAELGCGGGS